MFCSLINVKKINLKKRRTDNNPNFVRIVTVQDIFKNNPANFYRPLGTLIFINFIDVGILLAKILKINSAFVIINE